MTDGVTDGMTDGVRDRTTEGLVERTRMRRTPTESAIHDLGYRRYEGARIGAAGAWRSLFWQGVRAMFGIGRPAKAKAVPVFVLAVTNLPALATLSASSLSQGVLPIRYGPLIAQQLLMYVLFVAAQAPEVLSRDQQHRVLPLILTRDVTRASYSWARFAAIVGSLFVVALAPLFLLYIGEIGVAVDPAKAFARMGGRIWPVLAQASLTAIAIGGIAAALAAWTPRRAYATAAIIATFLVAAAVSDGLDDLTSVSRRTADMIDPLRSLRIQGMVYFGEKTRRMELSPPMPLWAYAGLLVTMGAAGGALLQFRIRRVSA